MNLEKIKESILIGDADQAGALTGVALAESVPPLTILDEALMPAMDIVGHEYETGERFIPEMLVSAEAMKASLSQLRPLLTDAGVQPLGRCLLGTVEGDLHDIGKDLVGMMLEGAGLEVINLGVNVSAKTMVEAVREHKPQIVAMSALLTTTMVRMEDIIKTLEQEALRASVKVMVGGAPLTQEYADKIGADGYAVDAPSAAALAKRLLGSETDA